MDEVDAMNVVDGVPAHHVHESIQSTTSTQSTKVKR
jgi:hypothetical protein